MGIRHMKLNIYQKLHKAACEARGVAKERKFQVCNSILYNMTKYKKLQWNHY